MLSWMNERVRGTGFRNVVRAMAGVSLLSTLMSASTGCALMDASREMGSSMRNIFTGRPVDRRDPTDEVDSWTSEVGMDARGNRARDKDPDSWWGRYVISEKHREIERNLGVDYE